MNSNHSATGAPAAIVSALLLIAATACAAPRASLSSPDADKVVLHVVNRSTSDVVVYVADGSVPARLGVVAGLERARLAIPARSADLGVSLLVITMDTGLAYASDPVLPGAGGVIELTVRPFLDESDVSVLAYGAPVG